MLFNHASMMGLFNYTSTFRQGSDLPLTLQYLEDPGSITGTVCSVVSKIRNDQLLTAVLREAWATLPESSSRPLPATLAQSRNLAHASLKTAVHQ